MTGAERVLFVFDRHDQLLDVWRRRADTNIRLLHFDFHCDMRGLLVDRQRQRAQAVADLGRLDEGNFLTHAFHEGRITSIRWVHDVPGGRGDDVGTVRYTTDLTAQPLRWFLAIRGKAGGPLRYEVMTCAEWDGVLPGEFLNLDWDFLASNEYALDSIQGRVDRFMESNIRTQPVGAALCYSERFVHASRDAFEAFAVELSRKLECRIVRLDAPSARPKRRPHGRLSGLAQRSSYQMNRWLR
ncbi:MAG: hypothetical protein ABI619_12765, partial [Betaproteobacteria bacterium]